MGILKPIYKTIVCCVFLLAIFGSVTAGRFGNRAKKDRSDPFLPPSHESDTTEISTSQLSVPTENPKSSHGPLPSHLNPNDLLEPNIDPTDTKVSVNNSGSCPICPKCEELSSITEVPPSTVTCEPCPLCQKCATCERCEICKQCGPCQKCEISPPCTHKSDELQPSTACPKVCLCFFLCSNPVQRLFVCLLIAG